MELDAIPHVLIVVRGADDESPRELPAELASAAVEVTEDQVGTAWRCCCFAAAQPRSDTYIFCQSMLF